MRSGPYITSPEVLRLTGTHTKSGTCFAIAQVVHGEVRNLSVHFASRKADKRSLSRCSSPTLPAARWDAEGGLANPLSRKESAVAKRWCFCSGTARHSRIDAAEPPRVPWCCASNLTAGCGCACCLGLLPACCCCLAVLGWGGTFGFWSKRLVSNARNRYQRACLFGVGSGPCKVPNRNFSPAISGGAKAGGYSHKEQGVLDAQGVIDKIDPSTHMHTRKEPEPPADVCVTPPKKTRDEERNPQ